jgi:hypothetical protein
MPTGEPQPRASTQSDRAAPPLTEGRRSEPVRQGALSLIRRVLMAASRLLRVNDAPQKNAAAPIGPSNSVQWAIPAPSGAHATDQSRSAAVSTVDGTWTPSPRSSAPNLKGSRPQTVSRTDDLSRIGGTGHHPQSVEGMRDSLREGQIFTNDQNTTMYKIPGIPRAIYFRAPDKSEPKGYIDGFSIDARGPVPVRLGEVVPNDVKERVRSEVDARLAAAEPAAGGVHRGQSAKVQGAALLRSNSASQQLAAPHHPQLSTQPVQPAKAPNVSVAQM